MTRESECVVVSIWANMPAPWFTICRKKKKHPTGSTFTCSKRSPPLSLFTRWNWIGFIYSLLPAYFLFRYTEWGVSMRKAARQQGRKTIHHGDSKDKHIYTCIHLGFFSPGPTRASPFFSLPSTFLRLSLHFISVICCTYIKWVVFYNNWFCPPPPILLRTTSTVTDECIFFCVMVCVTKGELIRNVAQQLFIQFSLPYSSVVDNIDVLRV